MNLNAEQIKSMAALREKLQEKAASLEEELEDARLGIIALDAALTGSSFTKASEYVPDADTPSQSSDVPDAAVMENNQPAATTPTEPDVERELLQAGDHTIGDIRTYPDRIVISLDADISEDTPPFRTFFMNRIIEGMKKKDAAEVAAGQLETSISCTVQSEAGRMTSIIIRDYRTEERAREISSTARWVLNRMLEYDS